MIKMSNILGTKMFKLDFRKNVENTPSKTAIIIGDINYSYFRLDQESEKAKAKLLEIGVKQDTLITFYCSISYKILTFMIAAFKIGAAPSIIHNSLLPKRVIENLNNTGSNILLYDVADSEKIQQILVTKENNAVALDINNIYNNSTQCVKEKLERLQAQCFNTDNLAFVISTTGSTSGPKPVALSHGNMEEVFQYVSESLDITSNEKILTYSALGTDYGFYNVFLPLALGGTVVSRPYPESGEKIVYDILKYQITGLQVFPPILILLMQSNLFPSLNSSSLRYISSSGQKLHVNNIKMILKNLPNVSLYSNYGMTECKRISSLKVDNNLNLHSVGKPLTNTCVKIVNKRGQNITKPKTPGELHVQSGMMMLGYVKNKKLDKSKHYCSKPNAPSYLKTGDIFEYDDKHNLIFKGRIDKIFHRHLYSVYPQEIENFLTSLPCVNDALVVPKYDCVAGEVPVAYVVLKHEIDIGEIMMSCKANLDWQSVPVDIIKTKELKTNASGKTDLNICT